MSKELMWNDVDKNLNALTQEEIDLKVKSIGEIIKEPFDYTKWQNNLFHNMNVRDLSKAAMESLQD